MLVNQWSCRDCDRLDTPSSFDGFELSHMVARLVCWTGAADGFASIEACMIGDFIGVRLYEVDDFAAIIFELEACEDCDLFCRSCYSWCGDLWLDHS